MTKKHLKITAFLLSFIAIISLVVSCTPQKAKPPANAGSILLAFTGEYNEEKHMEAIEKYLTSNNPMDINRGEEIVIPVNSGIKGAYIHLVADADNDPASELHLSLNLDIEYNVDFENKEIRIDTEWWYDDSSWVLVDGLWSFTVCVEYENGNTEWYYVRVNFVPEVESR